MSPVNFLNYISMHTTIDSCMQESVALTSQFYNFGESVKVQADFFSGCNNEVTIILLFTVALRTACLLNSRQLIQIHASSMASQVRSLLFLLYVL